MDEIIEMENRLIANIKSCESRKHLEGVDRLTKLATKRYGHEFYRGDVQKAFHKRWHALKELERAGII